MQSFGLQTLLQFIAVGVLMPPMLVVLCGSGFMYGRIAQYFRPSSRDMQRIETITHSPMYTHLSETLNGATTIRAFGHERRFRQANLALVDKCTYAWMMLQLLNEWLSIRLHIVSVTTMASLCVMVMLMRSWVNVGLVSLAIFYSASWGAPPRVLLLAACFTPPHYCVFAVQPWRCCTTCSGRCRSR